MDRKTFLLILLAGIITCLSSCTPTSCYDETDSLLDASFYNYATKTIKAPDKLSVHGLGIDTASIYTDNTGLKVASLPLNSASDSSVFIIIINDITDTLSVNYTSYPHLISKECGYTYYHDLVNVSHTRNNIDSIWINRTTVTNLNEENIRIFY